MGNIIDYTKDDLLRAVQQRAVRLRQRQQMSTDVGSMNQSRIQPILDAARRKNQQGSRRM